MVKLCLVILLPTILLVNYATADGCPSLPFSHFQWLNQANPQAVYDNETLNADVCCGLLCRDTWRPIPDTPGCQFCSSNSTLVCKGHSIPKPSSLPTPNLSLYKVSQVSLVSLPPRSFSGLSIKILVIENSNISFFAIDTFVGVKSIESLHLSNNSVDYIPQADLLFQNIKDLKFLSLKGSNLKVLSSAGSANLHNLTYFSLAGNALYTLDVYFLQNSKLNFLDLRNVVFHLKNKDIKDSGLSKLPNTLNKIDLSKAAITSQAIGKLVSQWGEKNIEMLNLGYQQHRFHSFSTLKHVKNTLQYLSLRGTDLYHLFTLESTNHFKYVKFLKLKELDLENCNISYFKSGVLTRSFPNLKVLSLANNKLITFDVTLFSSIKMIYVDLSNSSLEEITQPDLQKEASILQGADLSNVYFNITAEEGDVFFSALKSIQIVSLCQSDLRWETTSSLLNLKKLKYLDLSGAFKNSAQEQIFKDLIIMNNSSLTELHIAQNSLKLISDSIFHFSQLSSLETLNVSNNVIRQISNTMFPPTLRTLDASQNLITTWYFSILSEQNHLEYLDVSSNQITYVSDAMISDFYKVNSLLLDSNPLICHNKVVALVCSNFKNNTLKVEDEIHKLRSTNYTIYDDSKTVKNKSHNGQSTLVDWKRYRCYDLYSNGFRQFFQEKDCNEYYEQVSTTHDISTTELSKTTYLPYPGSDQGSAWDWEWTYLILVPFALVSALGGVVYLKWWSIKCMFHRLISLQKARLIHKNGNLSSRPEVYYDVFVSYSDVDRAWVLDHLVPNMERQRDISLCFHERDFQVGMSILENIIDCMDRSQALLLVVSTGFIYSKWCQFEMHLAQNRLIETFKRHLVVVLLEDIPRKGRPQTLHHLMMTTTYLMWPQQPSKDEAYELFWRRLKRALTPGPNNVSNQ